jgi:hypothetical protein
METTMSELSEPELRIIRSMLATEFGATSPLLKQISSLKFDARQLTDTGYFIDFINSKDLLRMGKLNTELSQDYRTTRSEPSDLVGFTLFIRNGFLTSFEGYMFGDVKWPDEPIESWVRLDSPAAAENPTRS